MTNTVVVLIIIDLSSSLQNGALNASILAVLDDKTCNASVSRYDAV